MTTEEYLRCTYREFILKLNGYYLQRTHEFENTRIVCYYIMAVNWDSSKKRLPTIQEFWPLPTDEIVDKDEEYKQLKEIIRKAQQNKLYQ